MTCKEMIDRREEGREEKEAFLEDKSCSEVSLSAQFQTETAQTLITKPNKIYAVYILLLLTSTYMVNQLDKFSLSVLAKPIAQELHYGDQECIVNKDVKAHYNNLTNNQWSQWKRLCNK